MLTALIDFSLINRFLIFVFTGLMALGGVYSALHLPNDSVPDMTNIQVQVITDAPGLTPLELERYVTYPAEQSLGGLPRFEELRSMSRICFSVVIVAFVEVI